MESCDCGQLSNSLPDKELMLGELPWPSGKQNVFWEIHFDQWVGGELDGRTCTEQNKKQNFEWLSMLGFVGSYAEMSIWNIKDKIRGMQLVQLIANCNR